MRVYVIDKSLHDNIIYSQLCIPLKVAKNNNEIDDEVLLLPAKFKEKYQVEDLNIHFYSRKIDKYKFLIKYRNKIKSIYSRSLLEIYTIFFIKIINLKKWHIRYDMRGLLSHESYLRNNSTLKKTLLFFLELMSLRLVNSVSTVSYKFKDYIVKNYYYSKNVIVTPCCTLNNYYVEKRNKRDLNFVYVGSIAKWQKFEESIRLFKIISQQIPNAKLNIVTEHVNEANKILNKLHVTASVRTLKNFEVSDFLKTQDFGFLLRDDVLLNNLASPVKFLEYISNGVIPIVSKGIGDYSELVLSQNLGIILNEDIDQLINQIKSLSTDSALQLRLYEVSSRYLWAKYYKNFII